MAKAKIIDAEISDLHFDDKNFNKGSELGKTLMQKSFQKFGAGRSILLDKNNNIIAGNKSTEEYGENGGQKVIIIESDGTELIAVKRTDIDLNSQQGREMALADNATAKANIVWAEDVICESVGVEIAESWGVGAASNKDTQKEEAHTKLTEVFIVPPFSVLDTRQGYWQERKKYWNILIGDNGESRNNIESKVNANVTNWDNKPYKGGVIRESSISILDSVLAEIVNKWFGLDKCKTFDCFAGDSVFGYVSSYLGNLFTGIELRQEQTDLNNQRTKGFNATYICDDGRNILNHIEEKTQDLLFSCPPYFDLEVYSDLPNDASNQKKYSDFLQILDDAFSNAIKCLKENRFAVITVGDIRGKQGFYYRFVDDIKDIFKRNNLLLYNELILIQSVGNGALRANRYMGSRKVVKVHEQVLVFYKGNPEEIKNIYPKIEIEEYESTDV